MILGVLKKVARAILSNGKAHMKTPNGSISSSVARKWFFQKFACPDETLPPNPNTFLRVQTGKTRAEKSKFVFQVSSYNGTEPF